MLEPSAVLASGAPPDPPPLDPDEPLLDPVVPLLDPVVPPVLASGSTPPEPPLEPVPPAEPLAPPLDPEDPSTPLPDPIEAGPLLPHPRVKKTRAAPPAARRIPSVNDSAILRMISFFDDGGHGGSDTCCRDVTRIVP